MKESVVIIGGGAGGLFCGALLSHEGVHVTVIEKNHIIGGGLQSFVRFGQVFDTGMHIISGMEKGGSCRRICEYLGIMDKVKIRPVESSCTDSLYFAEDRSRYLLAKGREGFISSLASYFPHEREGLESYVKALYGITEELDLFYLRPSESFLKLHSREFSMPATEFIARYIRDTRLRSVLAYMNPLYGGRGGETPAYIHAIISSLYINGTNRFVGGSSRFARTLAEVIEAHGGRVLKGEEVTHMEVRKRRVEWVMTASGKKFEAQTYISGIHPCALLRLLPDGAFPKAYRERLDSIPNSYSAFSLYIKMKDRSFPYLDHSEFYMSRYDDIWNFGRSDRPWPPGFLLMTPPEENQGEWSGKVMITAPMSFEYVRKWEHTKTGERGGEYEGWKNRMADILLERAEELHPGFREGVERVCSASPLTIRDMYGSKEGCMCGFSKQSGNLALSQLPVVTKVSNLLLTGQNINLHGFCGVALTAIETAEVILGRNHIINQINKSEHER